MEQAPKPIEPAKPRNRNVLIAIVIIILIGVGGAVYYLTRPPPSGGTGTPVSIFDGKPTCTPVTPPNCGFNPSALAVKIGTNNTVTWTNNGGAAHTVTANQTLNGNLPSFNSGSSGLSANQQFSFTLSQAGTYHYYCSFHPWMIATVVVSS